MEDGEDPEGRQIVGRKPGGAPTKRRSSNLKDCPLCTEGKGMTKVALVAHLLGFHGIRQMPNGDAEVANADKLAASAKAGTLIALPNGMHIKRPWRPDDFIEAAEAQGHMIEINDTNLPVINESVTINGVRLQFFKGSPWAQWWKWRDRVPDKGWVNRVPASFLNDLKKFERSLTMDKSQPLQASDYERGLGFGLGGKPENKPHKIGDGGLRPDMAEQEAIS